MKTIGLIGLCCTFLYCITAIVIVEKITDAAVRLSSTCPSPLEAGDYYTPEE